MTDEAEEQKRIAAHKAAVDKATAAMAKHRTKSLLDPTFRYAPSVETDLKKTFARIKRERAKQPEAQVLPIKVLQEKKMTPQ